MLVEMKPIDSIKPYEKNPRKNDGAVDAVIRSLREFGFRQPIVVDEQGVIVAGHTRYKAARKMGLTQVPVHVAIGLSEEKARAYRIADNQTGAIAEWDAELLAGELGALKALDMDLGMLGFDGEQLQTHLEPLHPGTPGLTDPDDVPAPPDEAITKPGDVWVLGNHRLLCGDSSSASDVDRLLAGQVIHLCNTDPPYNVKVEPRSNNAIAAGLSSFSAPAGSGGHHQALDLARHPGKAKPTQKKLRAKDRPLANDFVSDGEFDRLLAAWFGNIARVLVPGGGFYIWGGYANCANYPPVLKASELYFSQAIIWVKEHPVLTRKDFMGNHEWCFYGWREGAAHRFFGPNNVPDTWPIKKVCPQKMVHLTEKPVELARRAMEYSSKAGENVLDLFGGSGSTLIAAEQSGRCAFLMELDPLYCDVIVKRWEQFTGREARRAGVVGAMASETAGPCDARNGCDVEAGDPATTSVQSVADAAPVAPVAPPAPRSAKRSRTRRMDSRAVSSVASAVEPVASEPAMTTV